VPNKIQCPRCRKAGFVRFENVISRGVTARHYYCGSCEHVWRVTADGGTEFADRADDADPPGPSRPTRKSD